ncbi:hypothetical protein E2C01_018533 [Portunus trituberculatus]|uniref:Uncharacterized protein n=1 Tax=Portunus trituberculatus TaxID=210409 RepID=A0A5B7DWU7_PORTR|nr:hypothetical protein [Portunus trituberculatus]
MGSDKIAGGRQVQRPHSALEGKDTHTLEDRKVVCREPRLPHRDTSRTLAVVGVRVVHGVLKVQGPQLFNHGPEEI